MEETSVSLSVCGPFCLEVRKAIYSCHGSILFTNSHGHDTQKSTGALSA